MSDATVRRAAKKFLAQLFNDPISMNRVGRSRGVVLNKQTYNARSLAQALNGGYNKVPHSRRPLTAREKNKIISLAGRPAGARATAAAAPRRRRRALNRSYANREARYEANPAPAIYLHRNRAWWEANPTPRSSPQGRPAWR